jgi:uncharacterized membrane protein
MLHSKVCKVAILAGAGLFAQTTGGSASSPCLAAECATEWSGGQIINLGSPISSASGINSSGQIVGTSDVGGSGTFGELFATEWTNGVATKLQGGSQSSASAINKAGVVVGTSANRATEWSGGQVIDLGNGLPGKTFAFGINDPGQVVGETFFGNTEVATEWNGSQIIDLGSGLPGNSFAFGIDNLGQVVGASVVDGNEVATEWSGNAVINLGGLAGSSSSYAEAINRYGEVVGGSVVGSHQIATEWNDGAVINLGGLAGSTDSYA